MSTKVAQTRQNRPTRRSNILIRNDYFLGSSPFIVNYAINLGTFEFYGSPEFKESHAKHLLR